MEVISALTTSPEKAPMAKKKHSSNSEHSPPDMDELSKKVDALMAQTAAKDKRERLEFAIANAGLLSPVAVNGDPAKELQVKPLSGGFGTAPKDSTAIVQYVLMCFRSGDSDMGASMHVTNETGDNMVGMNFCDMLVDQITLLNGVKPHHEYDTMTGTLSFWYSEEEFKKAW